ncbi:MAG: hypothetical protein LBC59_05880 [Chitinispirillales bacterium]|nr:hypothetical protein [Chitinispirillales bacterium]
MRPDLVVRIRAGCLGAVLTAGGKNTIVDTNGFTYIWRCIMEESGMTDNIDEMLDEALDKSFRSVFEPDVKELVRAMFALLLMRLKLKTSKLMTADENLKLDKAFAIVGGYLDYAYPGFNKALMDMTFLE